MIDDVERLVARAQGGDIVAFGELYEQVAPGVYRFLLHRLNGHHEAAEDLTEEVFLKVLGRLGSYQSRGLPFSAWLYRITRNHLIDHVRSRPRQRVQPLETAAQIPERQASQAEARSLDRHELAHALDHLTHDQREVVARRFLDGFTTAETAALLEKTEDAVKKLQARGLLRMRRLITQMRRAAPSPAARGGRIGAA